IYIVGNGICPDVAVTARGRGLNRPAKRSNSPIPQLASERHRTPHWRHRGKNTARRNRISKRLSLAHAQPEKPLARPSTPSYVFAPCERFSPGLPVARLSETSTQVP